jgi:outer membrane protein TolC
MLPTARIDGSMTYTNTDGGSSGSMLSSSGETTIYTVGVSGNWTLFDGFRMFYGFKQVEQLAQFTEQASRHKIESSVSGVITAYNNLLALEAMLDAVKNQLDISRALLNKLKNRYDFGGTTKRVLLRQQVVVNADSASVLAMELDLIQARHALNVAMGRSPNAELSIIPDTTVSSPEHDAAYWFDHAKKHNAGLRMAEISVNIAESEYGIAKAAFWPVVAANGSLSQNFGDSEQKRLSAGLSLSWPIFTGFRTLTAAQNAKLDTKSAEYSLEQELKQLEALIYAQYERQQNAYNQINFERQAVQLAQKSLDVSREQYALGGISDVELREAQLALTQSQVRFQSALFQYKVTSMQLEQLAGTLQIK